MLSSLLTSPAYLCLCGAAFAAGPLLEKSDVFPEGFNAIARYRIPGMVVTTKGTVLAYSEARRNRSTDDGVTWDVERAAGDHGDV